MEWKWPSACLKIGFKEEGGNNMPCQNECVYLADSISSGVHTQRGKGGELRPQVCDWTGYASRVHWHCLALTPLHNGCLEPVPKHVSNRALQRAVMLWHARFSITSWCLMFILASSMPSSSNTVHAKFRTRSVSTASFATATCYPRNQAVCCLLHQSFPASTGGEDSGWKLSWQLSS